MNWFTRIDRRSFIYWVLVFLIIFLILAIWGDHNSYFVGNIVPESLGVCVELLIVLWVFDTWQEKGKRQKLITIERRLREYLIFFLDHSFKNLPRDYRVGRFFGKDHDQNIAQIKKLIIYIDEGKLSGEVVDNITNQCNTDIEALRSLLPAAAELTNKHFKAWNRIVYFVHCLAYNKDQIDTNQTVKDILQNIRRYDTASYEKKLYVGADRA
ncbi:hypothetical protein DSLASN_32060 [Desulfoluna limicola]|uniref:Uncharacterized protein n=1 Tax=Desulfoluna limicola TaxID=2810562 RepID=A0ABM7PJY5_9BACT|nr:hypothetical protein [Desulfoluna limicola]BCS97574.1 hypothetical protein DSLASN_32060 [Desulfoluna limicola]